MSRYTRVRDHLIEALGTSQVELPRESVAKVCQLIQDSQDAKAIVEPYLRQEFRLMGINTKTPIIDGPPKDLCGCFVKAACKYNGEVEKVPDLARVRVALAGYEDVIKVRERFLGRRPHYEADPQSPDEPARIGVLLKGLQHPTNQIVIKELEDYYWAPSKTGRGALHMKLGVKLSGNTVVPFEVQFILEPMLETEKITHDNYKRAERIEKAADLAGRSLSEEELETVQALRDQNKILYMHDTLAYNLLALRNPRDPETNRLQTRSFLLQESDYGYESGWGQVALAR